MQKEELFEQLERFLQRKLSPEECQFLVVASDVLKVKTEPPAKAAPGSSRFA
jgi:hypothetical protein